MVLGLASPFTLLWGWMKYLNIQNRSDWRSRASFVGLFTPIISGVFWVITVLLAWRVGRPASASNVPIRHLTMVGGICIPVLGMLIGLAGRPRLILAIVPASIGAVLFWVATTTP
jgi:hypothetical protein